MQRCAAIHIEGVAAILVALVGMSCDHGTTDEKHYSYLKELAIDTVLAGNPIVVGDSILLVYQYPGGCNQLDSVDLEIKADTIRPRVIYEFYYRGEPCAHGPGVDSVYLCVDPPAPGEYFLAYQSADSGTTVIPITIRPTYTRGGWRSASESFFPLEVGNRWVFAEIVEGTEMRRDTITISEAMKIDGEPYYHIRAPWQVTGPSFWGRNDSAGNLVWRVDPADSVRTLFKFDADIGEEWYIGPDGGAALCIEWLKMHDDTGSVSVPFGKFENAREFLGDPHLCMDFNWSVSFARGIGPVHWVSGGLPPPWEWVLLGAEVADSCCRGK